MIKKSIPYLLLLLLVVSGCATGVNEPPNNNGQDNDNPDLDVILNMQLDVLEEENATKFKISLKNSGEADAVLEFSSGQQYEVVVTNENGDEVYRFSEGRVFTQAFHSITIPAGESVEWLDTWEHDEKVVSGNYEVNASIKALKVNGEVIDQSLLQKQKQLKIEKQNNVTIPDNNAFRNIDVTNNGLNYSISGEARVFEGVYQYEVKEAGNIVLSGVETVAEGAPTWSQFTLSIDLNNVITGNGNVVLELFVYSANDGSKENILYVPLQ